MQCYLNMQIFEVHRTLALSLALAVKSNYYGVLQPRLEHILYFIFLGRQENQQPLNTRHIDLRQLNYSN